MLCDREDMRQCSKCKRISFDKDELGRESFLRSRSVTCAVQIATVEELCNNLDGRLLSGRSSAW